MPGQATDERSRPPEPLFHFLRNRCSTSSGFRVPLPPEYPIIVAEPPCDSSASSSTNSTRSRKRSTTFRRLRRCLRTMASTASSWTTTGKARISSHSTKTAATTLRVQLKSRVVISKKYQGKDLHLAFPADGRWYLVPHDKLIVIAAETTPWLRSSSWIRAGEYSAPRPSRADARSALGACSYAVNTRPTAGPRRGSAGRAVEAS